MLLPECLVWAMGNCTAARVYCEKEIRESIASRFTEVFNEEYEKVMDLIEEEDGDCNEREEDINPFIGARVTDYGVLLSFDSLDMYSGYGDFLASHDAGEALMNALKTIKKEYPSISYDGYVAYCWSDVHGGEVCQYEISSEKKRKKDSEEVVYDFLGETLGEMFGEVLQDDEVWESFSEALEDADENDFKKILKLLHTYAQWVPAESMDKIIELSGEADEDMKESLEEFVEALNAGENVVIEEDDIDTSNLPDGYMEAMEMFMMAEEISGKSPKRGEIFSSKGTFEIVIEKAKAGDAEAKFTAGKYFIADHIEEETERALRWIREAAEEGIEEAEEYMEEHEELFK